MRDSIISASRKKTELRILLGCFILAYILNIVSIISYHTPWTELFTTIHIVILFALVIYVILGIFRGLYRVGKMLFGKSA